MELRRPNRYEGDDDQFEAPSDSPFDRPDDDDDGPCALCRGGGPDIETYALIDFSMPVGNLGIVFVAGLTGWRESDGSALFITGAQAAAYRRAASTLAFMALINGQTFQFIRLSLNMDVAQAATLCGVTPTDVTNWENGTFPVPAISWQCLADAACKADMRAAIGWTPLPSIDLRPRTIRIYPDVPFPPTPPPCPPPCDPDPCPHRRRDRDDEWEDR